VLNALHPLALLDDDAEGNEVRPSCMQDDEGCASGYDFESVVTHEVGHFFGLGEDRAARAATMFFCQSRCEIHKRSLEAGDTAPLRELYANDVVTTSQAPGCGKSPSTSSRWQD